MKFINLLSCILIFICLCESTMVRAQDQITSVVPSSVYPGQSTDIIIHGQGTSFKNGTTSVNFGPGISCSRPTIINAETIDAYVTVSSSAPIGYNDLTVTTGTDVVVKHAAIQIFSLGNGVKATLFVNPVQSVNLSDFDPNNIANAPLLFTVTLYNDAVIQDLTVVMTITGQKMGQIATATKTYKNEPAGKIETLTNRQFDKYSVSNTNAAAIQSAIQTGLLPADVYDYHIEVMDDKNNDLADADGTNVITNPLGKPELISPGVSFSSDPEVIHSSQPLFQWFTQANSVDLNIYEVYPGQSSAAAVAINRPTFTQANMVSTTFLYPAGATVLQVGHTYAWQVTAHYSSASGPENLSSDMNWFTVSNSNKTIGNQTVSQITVAPNEVTISPGQSYKFSVKAYNNNNDTLAVKPIWTIIPDDGGNIDANGNFTANNNETSVAVVAACGEIKDYATAYISAANGNTSQLWDITTAMRQIFGLPVK